MLVFYFDKLSVKVLRRFKGTIEHIRVSKIKFTKNKKIEIEKFISLTVLTMILKFNSAKARSNKIPAFAGTSLKAKRSNI